MQLAKATSWFSLSICALALVAAACDPEDKPGTAIVLLVHSDIEELSSLQVKALDGEDEKEDEADEHTVQESFAGVGEVTPIVVKPGESDELLIVVSGFDNKRPKNALAEVSFRAKFMQGRTITVPVFLGNVCVNQFCGVTETCSGGPLQQERACSSIRALKKDEFTVVSEGEDPEWDFDAGPYVVECMDAGVWIDGTCVTCSGGRKPLPDGSCEKECDGAKALPDGECPQTKPACDGGTITEDGSCVYCADGGKARTDGMCPLPCDGGPMLPDGSCSCGDGGTLLQDGRCESAVCKPTSTTCDLFPQCGCKTGDKCQHMADDSTGNITTACQPSGPVQRGGVCDASSECVAGSTCVGGICRAYCLTNNDCTPAGECSSFKTSANVEIKGVKVCFTTCSLSASNVCALDTVCSNFSGSEPQRCVRPRDPCPYEEDGVCDDPTGTRVCAAGTDRLDCPLRMCATTPPNPPGGTCDLVTQCGCERTQGCFASWQFGGASMTQCSNLANPTLRQGAACENYINGCARGYGCFAGSCRRYCRSQSDCATGTCQDVTVRAVEDAGVGVDAGIVAARGLKVCR